MPINPDAVGSKGEPEETRRRGGNGIPAPYVTAATPMIS